jgi:hypothetical protein
MSSQFNSYRNRRYLRSRFLDGRFLLSQEATDIELELLEYVRRIISNLLGDVSVDNAWLTQPVPASLGLSNYQNKLIIRPGVAYRDGLLFEMMSGLDDRVEASADQPATIGSPNDPGGKIMDFTSMASGYYKIIVQAQEEDVTGSEDTFLQGASVPETTEEKRRVNYTISAQPSDVNGNLGPTSNAIGNTTGINPLTFTSTGVSGPATPQQISFFSYNDLFKVPVTSNTIVSASDTLGSSCAVTFSNVNGGGVLFPTGTLMSQVFTGGLLIDPDGTVYFINAVQVTTGPDQVTFTLDQPLAVPAGSGLQSQPNLGTMGLRYTLVAADINTANAATDAPVGTRNYAVANVYWNGSSFSTSPWGFTSSEGGFGYNIQDLRVGGTQEVLENMSEKILWELTGGGTISWSLTTQALTWNSGMVVKIPTDSSLQYTIAASDTQTLFGSDFAEDEVLYFVVPDGASGSTAVSLQKDVRGTNDLVNYDPSQIYVLAYRTGGRVHFIYDGLVLGDGESGGLGQGFYDQYLKLVRGGDWTNYPTQVNTLVAQQATTSSNVSSSSDLNWFAQPFTPSGSGILGQVTLYPYITGTPTGTFAVHLAADNAGVPGAILTTSFPFYIPSLGNTYPGTALNVPFFIPATVTASTQYWIIIDTTNANLSGGNTLNFNDDTASPAAYVSTDGGVSYTSLSTLALEYQAYTSVAGTGQTLYWDLPANIQASGVAENRNILQPGSVAFVNDGDVAYVTINRGGGAPANLSVSVANIGSVPVNENTFIIGRLTGTTILVGAQSFALASVQSSTLDGGVAPGAAGNNFTSDGIRWISAPSAAAIPSSQELVNLGMAAASVSSGGGVIAESLVTDSLWDSYANTDWDAQSFTVGGSNVTVGDVVLYLSITGGTASGPMTVDIYTYNSGVPGTLLGSSNTIDASTLTSTPTPLTFTFTSGPALLASTQYFLVWNSSGVTYGGGANIQGNIASTNPYPSGTYVATTDGGSSWVSAPGYAMEFEVDAATSYSLNVALKQSDGTSDPGSGASTVKIGFRSPTLTSGGFNERQVTSALSIVAPEGATFDLESGVNQAIYLYAIDNAGSVQLGLSANGGIDEGSLQNVLSIATGGASVLASFTETPTTEEQFSANTEYCGQLFTPSFTGAINSAVWNLYNNGVASSGNLVCEIWTDSSGTPGTLLETSSPLDVSTLTGSAANYTFTFSGSTILNYGSVYHLILNFSGVTYGSLALINISLYAPLDSMYPYGYEESTNSGSTWSYATTGAFYFQVNSSGAAATNNVSLYSSSALTNVPVRLLGRIIVNEATAGVYASNPLAMCVKPFQYDPMPIIGETKSAYLTEAQFQAQAGTGWILIDGRDISGTQFAAIFGSNTLPDARGTFDRMKDNGRGLDTNGDLALGTFENYLTAQHSHPEYAWLNEGGGFTLSVVGAASTFGFYTYTGGMNGGNPGNETAPVATVINKFIRVNY